MSEVRGENLKSLELLSGDWSSKLIEKNRAYLHSRAKMDSSFCGVLKVSFLTFSIAASIAFQSTEIASVSL